jgi:hypothetical protein
MVGYARSGWRKAAERFGAKLEGWVSRHSGAGLVEDRTHATETPVAECGNAVKFAQRYEKDLKIVRFTLGLRKKTLEAKIRRATNKSFLESNV